MFYFNWIDENTVFDANARLHSDIDIFDLLISEAETVYPMAVITVAANQALWQQLHQHSWAIISYDDGKTRRPVFKGYIHNFPIQFKGPTAKIELIAKPRDTDSQLAAIRQQMLASYDYDVALYPHIYDMQQADIGDLLTQHCQLVDFDRVTHQVKLVSYTGDDQPQHTVTQHFANSLDIVSQRLPLKAVNVHVNINWTQVYHGQTCLDPILQHLIPGGIITSVTGDDFKQRWWHNGESVGCSGYNIKQAALQEILPHQANSQPRTAGIMVSPKDPLLIKHGINLPKRIRLKKFHFRPSLTVDWHYQQPRGEQLTFQMRQQLSVTAMKRAHVKSLVVNLPQLDTRQNVIDWTPGLPSRRGDYCWHNHNLYLCVRSHDNGPSFVQDVKNWIAVPGRGNQNINRQIGVYFASNQGQRVVQQIKQQAAVMLHASRRCIDVKFSCAVLDVLHFSTRHTVRLEDPQLPQGHVLGKIKKLVFHVCGQTGQSIAHVTLACSLGVQEHSNHDTADENDLFESDIMESQSQTFHYDTSDQGLMYPQFMSAADILKGVRIQDDASMQEQELLRHQFPYGHNVDYILNKHRTQIKLELVDLKSLPRLKRQVTLAPIYVPAAIGQINI